MNIHIQDPKVSLDNFDFVIIPEHDGVNGKNVITTKGAIHYLRSEELNGNKDYLKSQIKKENLVTLIAGGPNKYYDYNEQSIKEIFSKIDKNFISKGFQLIFVPSMRTPQKIIDLAKNYFGNDQIIITKVDKKAYLSSLKISNYIVVTCDSTSMISEAAITGKPIYVAQLPSIKKNERFIKFFELFKSLNIIKDLEDSVENWNYEKLNETDRISNYIKDKIKKYEFS